MRILLSCLQAARQHAIPAQAFWRDYFVGGFGEFGHQFVEVPGADWAAGLSPLTPAELSAWKDKTWGATLEAVKRAQEDGALDLCLFYLYPHQVEESAVTEIRSRGIPCVNFFCDNVREFTRIPKAYSPFDLHWVPEHKALPLYAQAGLPHLGAPMPCWVPPQLRNAIPETEKVLRFIGSADETRRHLLAQVLSRDLPLEISGKGWLDPTESTQKPVPATFGARLLNWKTQLERQGLKAGLRRLTNRFSAQQAQAKFPVHGALSGFDGSYLERLASCAVCLGINRYPSLLHSNARPDTYSRLRDIEAPMIGTCYLTEWTVGLDQLYTLGEDIEVYHDADELCAKARELLANPTRRSSLRKHAFQRAHAEHSIGATLERLRLRLGITPTAP